jgi:hypothetical protein
MAHTAVLQPSKAVRKQNQPAAIDGADLQSVIYREIQSAAAPVATALNMPNMIPVDEASLGDFPWYWQIGTNFNAMTFAWLNSVFAFDDDGYVGTNGQALTTSLFNVLAATSYVLDRADADKLNAAVLANATVVNTIITDWTTTQGPIPPSNTTQAQQINYVTSQVLLWGNPGLTLGQLRNSVNPLALLPNVPVGGSQVVNDLMTYLANTSSVANIQAAVVGFNNELAQVRNNLLVPQPPPASAGAGYMTTVSSNGATAIQVEIDIDESTAVIQNNLLPAMGTGKSFSATFDVVQQANNTVKVTAEGGAEGFGEIFDFIGLFGAGDAKLDIFSADGSQTTCAVTLTFNGVTTITPRFAAYNVSNGAGWWFPDPIEQAANGDPTRSGYQFNPKPGYNFDVNGDFGAIARLMIAQQPVISLKFTTSNYAAYQKTFQENSYWGVSILGIPIAGGSQSYYQATNSYDSQSRTVTVTMNPVGNTTPVTPASQLATVIGAQIVWPGASVSANRAGI